MNVCNKLISEDKTTCEHPSARWRQKRISYVTHRRGCVLVLFTLRLVPPHISDHMKRIVSTVSTVSTVSFSQLVSLV